MDYKKIGEFIASQRKLKNLTQAKLAKELYVSEKTVSKWENGNGLPETSLLFNLCEILGVSLNELLTGQRLNNENYQEKAEDNLAKLLSQRKDNKTRIILSAIACFIAVSVLVVCVLLAGYLEIQTWLKVFLICFGLVIAILDLILGIAMDRSAGCYECKHCHKRFVPTMKAYVFGPHTLTTRYLKCPHCGESSYCKRRLSK